MVMNFSRRESNSTAKRGWRLYFAWPSIFLGRQVGTVGGQRWCEDRICKFQSCCVLKSTLLNCAVVYYSTVCSKISMWTHTKSNCKWIPKHADCDIRNRMSNFTSRPPHRHTYSYSQLRLTSISTHHHSTHWSSYIINIKRIHTIPKIIKTYVKNGPITLIVPFKFIFKFCYL
jgi:hypothetical protein